MAFGVSVTFQVDMSNETVNENGVHVAGSMQGWDPAATALSDEDADGIYSVTLVLTADDTVEYKYINGNAWGDDEFQGGSNRSLVVPDVDTVLPAYCFNSLHLCSEASITFQVDMNFETVSANGVHIAGSMQGWDPAA
ncbi:MAG: CBM20 domain-containing protein, partial [Candidatus Neomarinimicrobiota bacterium]|nr:CBM20 domain-containing protein [Candidatus Neomarinimicrobiota bacterium]